MKTEKIAIIEGPVAKTGAMGRCGPCTCVTPTSTCGNLGLRSLDGEEEEKCCVLFWAACSPFWRARRGAGVSRKPIRFIVPFTPGAGTDIGRAHRRRQADRDEEVGRSRSRTSRAPAQT